MRKGPATERRRPRRVLLVAGGLVAGGLVVMATGLVMYYPEGTSGTGEWMIVAGALVAAVGLLLVALYALVRFVKAAARD